MDTPGHAAFEAMRERGARLADIAILVVDGSRGVQPQTITSYQYLKNEKIPIVVALTKMDKKCVYSFFRCLLLNLFRAFRLKQTKQELQDLGLNIEEGNVPVIPISAITKEGIPELLDALLLEAGLMDIKADRYDTS